MSQVEQDADENEREEEDAIDENIETRIEEFSCSSKLSKILEDKINAEELKDNVSYESFESILNQNEANEEVQIIEDNEESEVILNKEEEEKQQTINSIVNYLKFKIK